MELVAEMRSRGIGANVHTYSALMNGAPSSATTKHRRMFLLCDWLC